MNYTNATTNIWWAKYYEVDINKPPHFPPGRQYKDHWLFGQVETRESKILNEAWQEYHRAYSEGLALKALFDTYKPK